MTDDPVGTAASSNPVLTTLVTAVTKANLVDTLNAAPALTVFAPTDCAFAALDPATLDAALADPTGLLTQVLGFHVIPGEELSAADLATKTSLTGGVGSRHSGESFGDGFELPPDRAYNETCAAIASIQWSWRMLLATGESRYADLIERALYNGVGAAISADGQRFFYVNPLQGRDDHYEEDDPGRRNEWFSCACCPPNIMRLMASLGHYLATTSWVLSAVRWALMPPGRGCCRPGPTPSSTCPPKPSWCA